jgi:hypothetical protein
MKTKYYLLLFAILCTSCLDNKKLIRKEISVGAITLQWYYYSYITDTSPDFVDVTRGKETQNIYKGKGLITDVCIKNDTIIIKTVEPHNSGIFYSKYEKDFIWGYPIKIDTTAPYFEIMNRKGICD